MEETAFFLSSKISQVNLIDSWDSDFPFFNFVVGVLPLFLTIFSRKCGFVEIFEVFVFVSL